MTTNLHVNFCERQQKKNYMKPLRLHLLQLRRGRRVPRRVRPHSLLLLFLQLLLPRLLQQLSCLLRSFLSTLRGNLWLFWLDPLQAPSHPLLQRRTCFARRS